MLCGVNVSGKPGAPKIQVLIDQADGPLSIESCAQMSRIIQDILDIQSWTPPNYRLEVSSPGIDFPLSELWQFRKNINRTIELKRDEVSLEGKIIAVSEEGLIELERNGSIEDFAISELEGAKVMIRIPPKTKHRRK